MLNVAVIIQAVSENYDYISRVESTSKNKFKNFY